MTRSPTPPADRLSPWPGQPSDLLVLFLLAIGGLCAGSMLIGTLLRHTGTSLTDRPVWGTLGAESGLLGGIAAFHFGFIRLGAGPGARRRGVVLSGVVTFLAAVPVVYGLSIAWQSLLEHCGVTVEAQDTVALFAGIRSPVLRWVFAAAALVGAPVGEELVFRAGLFRFLHGRLPRWTAIIASALIFGGAHLVEAPAEQLGSLLPLIALGVVFALAYERTGRIGTTMIAHSLFNCSTLLAVWLGLGP